jgi:hypothetical protein
MLPKWYYSDSKTEANGHGKKETPEPAECGQGFFYELN